MLNQETVPNREASSPVTLAGPALDQTEPVFRIVSTHAARAPQSPAVLCGDLTLSYRELEDRSNRLALYFSSCGIGLEHLVALWLPRSPWLMVAALAAHKAGAAYLPLDPMNPQDRLHFMVHDSEAKLVITESALASSVQSVRCPVLCIDKSWEKISKFDAQAPDIDVAAENLAYVIYTSGSTGAPKGVELTHSNLANLVLWHHRAFGISPADRASHLAGLGFDASVWETWPYLAAGASLHLAPQGTLDSPEQLRDWLVRTQITVSFVPTPMAEGLLRTDWAAETKLRLLLTGGDVLRVRPRHGLPFETVNNYGPTECAVVSTSGTVEPSSAECDLPPIGSPIDNSQVYVLDGSLRPVPEGVPGELYIGGANVGRGYRKRPDLTARTFVQNPFDPGTRMYKTGDLGCYRRDGQITFRGRVDNQIKIRGYRIEPDEIAAVLNQHPAIRASVVVSTEHNDSGARLLAYIVATTRPTRSDLQDFVRRGLPDYMVPSIFVLLSKLPMTSNGKVDVAALPAPSEANTVQESSAEPTSAIEKQLTSMLGGLLGIAHVKPEENFFLLGGHSLMGTQLIARVREIFQVEVPLRTLFEHPTAAGLAEEVERRLNAKAEYQSRRAA